MKRTHEYRIRVLNQLAKTWSKFPDMRLCQLIVNTTNRNDPFYVEDGALTDKLLRFGEGNGSLEGKPFESADLEKHG